MRLLFGLALLLPVPALAQVNFTLPSGAPLLANTNLPLSAGIGHYQQWFRASEFTNALPEPMRLTQLQFLAGSSQTAINTSLDIEVMVGHASATGITGLFAMNFQDTPVLVFPRNNVNLSAGIAGQPVVTIPFAQSFTWDGTRAVVVDIKVYGNGQGNQLFNYNFRSTQIGGVNLSFLYQGGSANATSGTVYQGQGCFMRFTARPGVTIPFGRGCPSNTFVTPVASVSQIPWPGITWVNTLSQASAQRLCALVMGDSNTRWGGLALPYDLTNDIGASGCFLLVNPLATIFTQTVGSPGAAIAQLQLPLPPITSYVGFSLYSQWLVLDPSALNGVLSASGAIRSIVAPVGG